MLLQRCAVHLAILLGCTILCPNVARAAISFRAPILTSVTSAADVRAADMDGDGKMDLVVVGSRVATVLFGEGDGSFRTRAEYAIGEGLHVEHIQFVIADLNGDGARDYAVPVLTLNKIVVFLNQGNRRFAPAVNYPVGGSPDTILAGDFNSDGKPDLAVSHLAGSLGVMLNRGDGVFQPPVTYPAMSSAGGLAAADFNGDGNLDLALGCFYSNPGLLFLGDGRGKFQVNRFDFGGDTPARVVADDFDGDGKPDLVSANYHSNSVSLLLGDGLGTLGAPINYAAPEYPFVITSSDLDGDGNPDLVMANAHKEYFTVLNNGDGGNLLPAVRFPSGGALVQGLATADFNGDGRPDVATANRSSDTVAIHLNDTPRPSPAILAFDIDPKNPIGGCQTATGTITLTAPAPAGGTVVTLTSTNPAVVPPPTIIIPEGAVSTSFMPTIATVPTPQSGSLTARIQGSGKRAVVTVRPSETTAFQVTPSELIGGNSATGQVTFACAAGAGGLVISVISSHPQLAQVPATVSAAAGATGASFSITTRAVTEATPVVITATFAGLTRAVTLLLRPVPPPPPPLQAPTGLTAQVIFAGQVNLGWTDNSGDETGFALFRREGSGDWQWIALVGPSITRFADLEVRSGVSYTYRVQAVSDRGPSGWSNEASVTLPQALQPPAAPTNLIATAFSATEIGVIWQDNSNDEAAFLIFRQDPGGVAVPIATVPPNTTSYLDRGLKPSTAYRYQVRAWNPQSGTSRSSNEAVATTRGP